MSEKEKNTRPVSLDSFEFRQLQSYVDDITTARKATDEMKKLLLLLKAVRDEGNENTDNLLEDFRENSADLLGMAAIFGTIANSIRFSEFQLEDRLTWLQSDKRRKLLEREHLGKMSD